MVSAVQPNQVISPDDPGFADWVLEQVGKSKAARARFARRQAKIGRPVPRSATDPRPDPGTDEGGDPEEG